MLLLLQPKNLSEFSRTLQKEFSTSWSIGTGLTVVGFFAVVVILVWYFSRRETRAAEGVGRGDPGKLFRDLLERLPLSTSQRTSMILMAHDLKLAHPSVVLLSPNLFQQCADSWFAQRHPGADPAEVSADLRLLAQIGAVLFPGR